MPWTVRLSPEVIRDCTGRCTLVFSFRNIYHYVNWTDGMKVFPRDRYHWLVIRFKEPRDHVISYKPRKKRLRRTRNFDWLSNTGIQIFSTNDSTKDQTSFGLARVSDSLGGRLGWGASSKTRPKSQTHRWTCTTTFTYEATLVALWERSRCV